MIVSPALATSLTLIAVLAGVLALVYAVARGVPARDPRPGVGALASGFVAANAAFVLLTLGAVALPTLCVVWAGGFSMLLCVMWHLVEPRSWHVVWDAFTALCARVHPLGALVFLTTLLVMLALLLLRLLRAFAV